MSKDEVNDARTVFVRNIAFDVDQALLEQTFADIGPVRSAFLVTEKGQQRHKGIAFVQYAIPEDADRAAEELHGKELNGRKLKIEHARKRAPLAERKQRKRPAEDDHQQHHQQQQQQEAQPAAFTTAAAAALNQASAASDRAPPAKKFRPTPQQQQAAADKHKWVRSVALGGLKPEFKPHALQLAAAAGGLVEVLDPPPADVSAKAHLQQDGCSGDVVFLVYSTVKEATAAVKQLHGKQISGADLAAAAAAAASKSHKLHSKKSAKAAAKQQRQQQQQEAPPPAVAADAAVLLWARGVSGEGALVKKWRLILRNLPWQVTESDIRKLLILSGSFPWQIQIPTNPDGRTRGFAFVSFLSHPEADKALQTANGQLVRKRPVAADWAVGKGQYQDLKGQGLGAAAAAAAVRDDDVSDDGGDQQGLGRCDESEQGSENEDDSDQGLRDDSDQGLRDDSDQGLEDDSDQGLETSSDGLAGSEGESEESEISEEEIEHDREVVATALGAVLAGAAGQQQQQPVGGMHTKQQQQQPAEGMHIKQQQQQQQPAGGLQIKQQQQQEVDARQKPAAVAAAVAVPAGSGAVADTVFVRGVSMDTTSQDLQARFDRFGPVKACRLVVNKSTGKPKGTAFIEFKTSDGAAAAAAACARATEGKGAEILVKGVKLEVDLALTGDDARKLGQTLTGGQPGQSQTLTGGSKAAGGKFDRRNLYLAKEGDIEEGSAQWMGMSENDRRKRKRAAEEKNEKLKSPNFAVSMTRLAVRNIPGSWDEQKLKAAFIAGVKQRATKEHPQVKQVKILRDPERTDPGGNPAGKSRGFGFVEFSDHSHALAALRQLNNNPKAFGSADRRPIVAFAVDNVKILKSREDKLSKHKQWQQQKKGQQQQQGVVVSAAAGVEQNGHQQQQQPPTEKLSKRQLKRRKEKEAKVKRQQQQENGAAAPVSKRQQLKLKQQQGKRGSVATAAAAAATEARAATMQAKAVRQRQQVAAEDAVRGKKRRADDELDRLAAAAAGPGARSGQQQQRGHGKPAAAAAAAGDARKRHKPGRAQEDKLEKMVEDYKSKLFGLGSSAAAGGKKQQRDGIKASRWFE